MYQCSLLSNKLFFRARGFDTHTNKKLRYLNKNTEQLLTQLISNGVVIINPRDRNYVEIVLI